MGSEAAVNRLTQSQKKQANVHSQRWKWTTRPAILVPTMIFIPSKLPYPIPPQYRPCYTHPSFYTSLSTRAATTCPVMIKNVDAVLACSLAFVAALTAMAFPLNIFGRAGFPVGFLLVALAVPLASLCLVGFSVGCCSLKCFRWLFVSRWLLR